VEHAQHRPEIAGLVERQPRDPPLGRLIRRAMVASVTRYAVAICREVRPPTARSVKATAEFRARVGFAHRKAAA
jgi:hypothetical protein